MYVKKTVKRRVDRGNNLKNKENLKKPKMDNNLDELPANVKTVVAVEEVKSTGEFSCQTNEFTNNPNETINFQDVLCEVLTQTELSVGLTMVDASVQTDCEINNTNNYSKVNLYSQYKAHTTFKVLIGCTPNGGISYVSDLFEGSISDRQLFEQCGIINLLELEDLVLADRGFTVNDLVQAKGANLNIPPFLKGRDRLTPQEEIETKEIARERIYVEHIIGRLKTYRLLTRVIPLSMRGIVNQIVFVCAWLVNFGRPVVVD